MGADNYYLVTALPALGDLGTPAPLSLAALRDHVEVAARPRALIEAIFLGDDLLQRDASLAEETDEVEPTVLSAAQVRNEEPLPPFLATGQDTSARPAPVDDVWAAYFRYADQVARDRGSAFLKAWVAYEVALRNALAEARAKALELDPADYLVAAELADPDEDFSPLVGDWSSAGNPLEGLKRLDQARWDWLAENDAWFSFSDDELAVYAARLMLLARWHRLSGEATKRES